MTVPLPKRCAAAAVARCPAPAASPHSPASRRHGWSAAGRYGMLRRHVRHRDDGGGHASRKAGRARGSRPSGPLPGQASAIPRGCSPGGRCRRSAALHRQSTPPAPLESQDATASRSTTSSATRSTGKGLRMVERGASLVIDRLLRTRRSPGPSLTARGDAGRCCRSHDGLLMNSAVSEQGRRWLMVRLRPAGYSAGSGYAAYR